MKRSLVHLVLGLGALLPGCSDDGSGAGGTGADGGGAGGTAGSALVVAETVPPDTATDVATDTTVSVQFDAALNGETVTATSFAVRGGDGVRIAGTVALDMVGRTVTFTPDEPLALRGTHIATLTTDIESVDGNRLRDDYTWSFTTRDGAWSGAIEVLVDDAIDPSEPRVAVDSTGNAMVVWREFSSIRAKRYLIGTGWDGARVVHNVGTTFPPEVAFDSGRQAMAVWSETESGRSSIWANRYTPQSLLNPNSGWGDAELLEFNDSGNTRHPHIAMNPDGVAVAVWIQPDGPSDSVWASRFTESNGWVGPELIEVNQAGPAQYPRVAVDRHGNAMAVWNQLDGSRPDIWANRFTPEDGWGTAESIEAEDGEAGLLPQVALDSDRNAIAVWHQFRGGRNRILANRFTPDAGWGTAEPIEAKEDGEAVNPNLAVDPRGNGIAVWTQEDGMRRDVWANRFTVDTGWGTPELLEINNAGGASAAWVAADPSGNAIATWIQHDGSRHNLWANRFTHDAGWGGAELLEQHDNITTSAHIAMSAGGTAVVVWGELLGSGGVWANHFE